VTIGKDFFPPCVFGMGAMRWGNLWALRHEFLARAPENPLDPFTAAAYSAQTQVDARL
jgi:hypothetical protein